MFNDTSKLCKICNNDRLLIVLNKAFSDIGEVETAVDLLNYEGELESPKIKPTLRDEINTYNLSKAWCRTYEVFQSLEIINTNNPSLPNAHKNKLAYLMRVTNKMQNKLNTILEMAHPNYFFSSLQ